MLRPCNARVPGKPDELIVNYADQGSLAFLTGRRGYLKDQVLVNETILQSHLPGYYRGQTVSAIYR